MVKRRSIAMMIGMLAIVMMAAPASWAWRRGGVRIGIGLGWPWYAAYPYYYPPYDPYYYSYPYDPPGYAAPLDYYDAPRGYASTPPSSTPPENAPDDDSPRDLSTVKNDLSRMCGIIKYKYDDGDISKAQYKAAIHYLNQIADVARAEAKTNGGTLAANQEDALIQQIQQADPSTRRGDIPYPEVTSVQAAAPRPAVSPAASSSSSQMTWEINDLLLELRTLLSQKLKEGAITQAQHDSEAAYLSRIESQAHSKSSLSGEEKDELVRQLHRAYYAINHNLVVH